MFGLSEDVDTELSIDRFTIIKIIAMPTFHICSNKHIQVQSYSYLEYTQPSHINIQNS
jgi:hypothetical protein